MTGRGVVACGYPITAEVAVDVLRSGGNAVDALVAAAFASFVCEVPLTGLAGGGYMLIRHPTRGSELLDFFTAAPGLGVGDARPELQFEDVVLDFGPTTQTFHIGYGSAAVPGSPAGMVTAHSRWGSIPLIELMQPAIRLAREGFVLTRWSEIMFRVLEPIVTYTPAIRAMFAPRGELLVEGERLHNPDLVHVLEAIGREGHAGFYSGPIAHAIIEEVNRGGGQMSLTDLAEYRTLVLEPLKTTYRGHQVELTPGPSVGGTLIALSLAILERAELDGVTHGDERLVRALVHAMDATNAIRAERFPGGTIDTTFFETLRSSLGDHLATRRASAGNTTHISVVDGDGMIASCSNSYGEGCGHIVPGIGLELNNMLGEEDLNPHGFDHHQPGARLPSMMCPVAVETRDGALFTMGSGGSNRIRTALLQVLVNVLDCRMSLSGAIEAPRIHYEDGTLHVEPATHKALFDRLEGEGVAITTTSCRRAPTSPRPSSCGSSAITRATHADPLRKSRSASEAPGPRSPCRGHHRVARPQRTRASLPILEPSTDSARQARAPSRR